MWIFLVCLLFILINGLEGQTKCPQNCIIDSPVCGSDGKIYPSKCEMNRLNCGKNLTVVDKSFCGESSRLCPLICLKLYDPVCGDDRIIYNNKCIMQKSNCGRRMRSLPFTECLNQTRASRTLNRCPKVCLDPDDPVCGSDRKIYRNECVLRLKNCGITKVKPVAMNHCIESPDCPQQCLFIQDPVCGSDKKVYLNECQMKKKNCGRKVKKISLVECTQSNSSAT